ncbi:MAG: hypothetical protein HYS17_11070 [Micavibrio aeruginosavorus]|uniref:Bbp19-like phage domain-containing protein n=1 Tax=Micavibrio aeruginosavorus TaxID=349221 RepID=A0A7T5R4L6_9BACT|nr:MAG: hypothetical protein HYS17_11070 [Micavibrio aeruginosavorus]
MPEPLSGGDRRSVEKAYARLFSGEDGKAVLGHLQNLTFARAYGADAPEGQLRYAEGQRALVALILRWIHAGRQPS